VHRVHRRQEQDEGDRHDRSGVGGPHGVAFGCCCGHGLSSGGVRWGLPNGGNSQPTVVLPAAADPVKTTGTGGASHAPKSARTLAGWTTAPKSVSSLGPVGPGSPRNRRAFRPTAGTGASPGCAAKRSRCSPGSVSTYVRGSLENQLSRQRLPRSNRCVIPLASNALTKNRRPAKHAGWVLQWVSFAGWGSRRWV
jgi:hypothetical protein